MFRVRAPVLLFTPCVLAACATPVFDCDTTPRLEEQCTVFRVDSRRMLNPSGLTPAPGERYRITLGESDPPWQDAWLGADPASGWPWFAMGYLFQWNARQPKAPMFSLVCTTSTDPARGWQVISGAVVEPARHGDGAMACFANDWPPRWAYDNNRGCLKVTVCPVTD